LFTPDADHEDLLIPILRSGQRVYDTPPLADLRRRAADQLADFDTSFTRLASPSDYPTGLEPRLHDHTAALIAAASSPNGAT